MGSRKYLRDVQECLRISQNFLWDHYFIRI